MSRKRKFYNARQLAKKAHYRQGGLCFWCREPMVLVRTTPDYRDDPKLMTAEHVVPKYAGGQTRPGNIVAACYHCNNTRNPETNQIKPGAIVGSVGDDEVSSPFEVLRTLARYQR